MKNIIIALILMLSINISNAQDKKVNTVQPTIMVIPFTKKGQDIRTILERSFEYRVAVTKVKEGFDNRGFTTIDFRSKLKSLLNSQAFESAEDNQTSIKQQIIENSGADIYVEVDAALLNSSNGNAVTLNLTANDAFTGQTLSNKVGESGKWYTDDVAKLASKAVEKCIEPFLNTLNDKFTEIVANGRSVVVNIGFGSDSESTMDDEVGEDELPLSDALEMWFEENAYNNYYHIQGVTSTKMILDDVKIPLKDPKTGNNYRATKFALKLYMFVKKKLALPCTKDVNGSNIYITIN